MRPAPLDSAKDIEDVARTLLKESKAFGVFPTPVDRIVEAAELRLAEGTDLSLAKQSFFSKAFEGIGKVSQKVLGLLDFREKTIYLDLQQHASRQRFIKLHEVGHDALPWQESVYRWDDEKTISPAVKEVFEKEASSFASAALFQLERFDEEAKKLPLSINSPLTLAKKFGASCQATIRRYVQLSHKRCAVLVLERSDDDMVIRIRNCFESNAFVKEFGKIDWPNPCEVSFPFVQDMLTGRKHRTDGNLLLDTPTGQLAFSYHFFNNSYNGFVFLFPPGEFIRTRTKIVLADARPN